MIKVLWFSLTSSCYSGTKTNGYNGGGWISSLEKELTKCDNIQLGVAFMSRTSKGKEIQHGVTYYPMTYPKKTLGEKWKYFFNYSVEDEYKPYIARFKSVVDDFCPDVIHIFGSESLFGFVKLITNTPCVLHIQGILNPYKNAFFPPSVSKESYMTRSLSPRKILQSYREMITWRNSCLRERALIKIIDNYIGRTKWDEIITRTINPHARYFYGSEILRPSFYSEAQHKFPEQMTIISTSSGTLYKGLDLILKTAQILKLFHHCEFKWIVFGNTENLHYIEKMTGIAHEDVNVDMAGIGTEEDIYNALVNATAFAHPSYIDNSPNAVCEAQLVGCPVVATDVGGIKSLIVDGETGFLVPANDPYQMAWRLKLLFKNRSLAQAISQKGKNQAKERHNKEKIVNELINVYKTLLNEPIIQESLLSSSF